MSEPVFVFFRFLFARESVGISREKLTELLRSDSEFFKAIKVFIDHCEPHNSVLLLGDQMFVEFEDLRNNIIDELQVLRNKLFLHGVYFKAFLSSGLLDRSSVREAFSSTKVDGFLFGKNFIEAMYEEEVTKSFGFIVSKNAVEKHPIMQDALVSTEHFINDDRHPRTRQFYDLAYPLRDIGCPVCFMDDDDFSLAQQSRRFRQLESNITFVSQSNGIDIFDSQDSIELKAGAHSFISDALKVIANARGRKRRFVRHYTPMLISMINSSDFTKIKYIKGRWQFAPFIFQRLFIEQWIFTQNFDPYTRDVVVAKLVSMVFEGFRAQLNHVVRRSPGSTPARPGSGIDQKFAEKVAEMPWNDEDLQQEVPEEQRTAVGSLLDLSEESINNSKSAFVRLIARKHKMLDSLQNLSGDILTQEVIEEMAKVYSTL